MANRRYTQFFNTLYGKPVLLNCKFVVTPTDPTGVTLLKGPGISRVFMHTSTTPAAGNPNPANGVIIVKFNDNFPLFLNMSASVSAAAGTPTGTLTANTMYTITSVGTTTTAQWVAKGLPVGTVPAVGVAFVATASGALGGTGTAAPAVATGAGVDHFEVVGNPEATINSSAAVRLGASQGSGSYILVQAFNAGAIVAPATGSTVRMQFLFNNTSILNPS